MTETFTAVEVIRAKRDGRALTDAQIDWVVGAYTAGIVAEEQMAALAMAILLNGMQPQEIARIVVEIRRVNSVGTEPPPNSGSAVPMSGWYGYSANTSMLWSPALRTVTWPGLNRGKIGTVPGVVVPYTARFLAMPATLLTSTSPVS